MNPTGKKIEKYQNLGIDKNNLNKWQKKFIREFVNDHGNAWRPLRGLWVEDVLGFIQKEIDSALSSQLKEVLGVIESKKIQPEYVGRDDVDISYFVNFALDKVKAEVAQLAEGEK